MDSVAVVHHHSLWVNVAEEDGVARVGGDVDTYTSKVFDGEKY